MPRRVRSMAFGLPGFLERNTHAPPREVDGEAAAHREQILARRYALGRRLDGSAPARAVGDPASVEESPLNVAVLADDPLGEPVQVQASGALALRVAYDRIISRRYEGRCPNLPQRPLRGPSGRHETA